MPLEVEKFLMLVKSNLSIFFGYGLCLGGYSKEFFTELKGRDGSSSWKRDDKMLTLGGHISRY